MEYEWFDVAPEWDSDEDEFVDELDASAGFLSASFVYRFEWAAIADTGTQGGASPRLSGSCLQGT